MRGITVASSREAGCTWRWESTLAGRRYALNHVGPGSLPQLTEEEKSVLVECRRNSFARGSG